MMKYKRSELTQFAKNCAYGANQILNGVCMAEFITTSNIGKSLANIEDKELLLEISKRFAKYAKDQMSFNVENGEVQNFQNIISKIVDCCEEHDWFEEGD